MSGAYQALEEALADGSISSDQAKLLRAVLQVALPGAVAVGAAASHQQNPAAAAQ